MFSRFLLADRLGLFEMTLEDKRFLGLCAQPAERLGREGVCDISPLVAIPFCCRQRGGFENFYRKKFLKHSQELILG